MKKLLLSLLILCGMVAQSQVYNNEWIDYSKTYYKFKSPKTGLHRISQATLVAAGLGSVPAEHFQLWRNGVEVPLFTTVATGVFSGSDYIEFWGEMNDGRADKALYRQASYQLNDKFSLATDSATYFLTVNPTGNSKRLVTTPNNVSGTSLLPEPYFMYKAGKYYKDRLNPGFAVDVEEYLYSSSYDAGEGWTSVQIGHNGSLSFTFNNLYLYSGGPAPGFKISVSGNGICERRYRVTINGDSIIEKPVSFFNHRTDSTAFSSATIASDVANVIVYNMYDSGNSNKNRMVVHKYEMVYPRQFNFGGASNFEFSLPTNAAGNYLQITNFNYGGGSVMPVLYDITNGKRYVAEVSAGVVRVVLEGSATERKLILVNEELSNTTAVTTLQSRTFTNYSLAQNQGDYMIISHPMLYNGSTGNPVEDYRVYRSSANGGSYNAKVYNIDDIVDQFGFGILKNPLGLRNFIWFARNTFPVAPKHVFLIGKAVNYTHTITYQNNPDYLKLSLVPTFGWPASDILLAADPGSSQSKVSIGRLSAISPDEVSVYLKKVKDFELVQKNNSPLIADKAWMKNVVHAVGASAPDLQMILDNMMTNYGGIISDTLFGAKVTTFTKSSASAVEQINNGALDRLFEEGITLITYFGHSSSTTLEFNMNNPEQFNNFGKYPMFIALGCNAGNYFNFNPGRFTSKETLSEKFVFAQDRGTIGFVASSHFGIVHYLDIWNTRNYKAITSLNYGQAMGDIMKSAIEQTFAYSTQGDFYARAQCEETSLHGDPAIILNPHSKPDYVIEDHMVKASPGFVSVADRSFIFSASFLNIGKAINKTVVAQVIRKYPSGVEEVIYRDTLNYIKYSDSIQLTIDIDPLRDKGLNTLIVKIDADDEVLELFESNNTVSKEIFIYEDEARPVYPYNYSIISNANLKLTASTANPFSSPKTYRMEIDTTELFNSPVKLSSDQLSSGGLIEITPNINLINNTVYYWRVAPLPSNGPINWNASSFVYLSNYDAGYNQSHLYQHFKSDKKFISLDSSTRNFSFTTFEQSISATNGVYPTTSAQNAYYYISINGFPKIGPGCNYDEIIINVLDGNNFQPWTNGTGLYNSNASCASDRIYNFMYLVSNTTGRKSAMDFLDLIPSGSYVIIRNNANPNQNGNTYPNIWLNDTLLYGSGNSLYHKLYNNGFADIDSFNRPRAWVFIYRKNDNNSFTPVSGFSQDQYDGMTLVAYANTLHSEGTLTSPKFGPAREWKKILWSGAEQNTLGSDVLNLGLIGVRSDGGVDTLLRNVDINLNNVDISNISALQYPFLQLYLKQLDTINYTPYQLDYWRITNIPAPEGAVAPNILFWMRDSIDVGDTLEFKLAFKNVSNVNFSDSMKVKAVITDRNNVAYTVPLNRQKILLVNDTLTVRLNINTRQFVGQNQLFIELNPDNDQPEQYHFNNFIYYNFYVKGDYLAPLLDITFDNVHIVNRDVVSAKPHIQIKLKDESSTLLLDDSSLVKVQVMDPDGIITSYQYGTDTLNFTPAQQSSNNTAMVDFNPYFTKDGDYELIVTGEDKSGNSAGNMEYRVGFRVISKAMISNMLNYPNPFTTSTAFIFTITGSEVPQNIKIQILTITGKVVREITKDELGPLRVGRNITEYKWDGTDQYGQKLANGVYLYRVVTNLNGKALEKFRDEGDDTDKYFKKGYGKMYLMR